MRIEKQENHPELRTPIPNLMSQIAFCLLPLRISTYNFNQVSLLNAPGKGPESPAILRLRNYE
jgi:hypothetical protein